MDNKIHSSIPSLESFVFFMDSCLLYNFMGGVI